MVISVTFFVKITLYTIDTSSWGDLCHVKYTNIYVSVHNLLLCSWTDYDTKHPGIWKFFIKSVLVLHSCVNTTGMKQTENKRRENWPCNLHNQMACKDNLQKNQAILQSDNSTQFTTYVDTLACAKNIIR